MTDSPHVCFLALNAFPVLSGDRRQRVVGGAEVQQSILARALARAGHRVSMICFDHGQPDGVEIDGVRVLAAYRPHAGPPGLGALHPRLTSVWRALGRAGADLYWQQCSGYETAVMAAFGRRSGLPTVYCGGSNADFVPGREIVRGTPHRWLFQHGLRRVTHVVTQNPVQRELLRRHYGRDSTVIPNMFEDAAGRDGDPAGHVLWVANLRREKRPDRLVELARRLPGRRFVMAGGAYEDDPGCYDRIVPAARALANVEVRGHVPYAEVGSVFDGAALLVCTSDVEGFPNTFLQAWIRGVPVVSFFDTGLRPTDAPEETLVASVEQAAGEIERLLGSPASWHAASARAKERFARSHSVAALLPRYRELFAGLAAVR